MLVVRCVPASAPVGQAAAPMALPAPLAVPLSAPVPAQAAQTQRCPRSAKGRVASTSGGMQVSLHQHFSADLPSARAHWLLWWHSGHKALEKPGAEKDMAASVGGPGAISAGAGSARKNGALGRHWHTNRLPTQAGLALEAINKGAGRACRRPQAALCPALTFSRQACSSGSV